MTCLKHLQPKNPQCYQTLRSVDGQDASGIVGNAVETLTISYWVDNVKSRAKELNKKHELNKRDKINS